MPVIECSNDDVFNAAMAQAGSKPVIIDFTAAWCGPCKTIAPLFEEHSNTYGASMVFLKVDVDKCENTSAGYGVSAMPTFMVYLNGKKVDSFTGANADKLAQVCKQWGSVQQEAGAELVPGQIDLLGLIEKGQVECLNGCDDTPIRAFLENPGAILRSDCDEQLIVTIPFVQPVRLHSILFKGVGDKAPKKIRIFANLPKTLDFDDAMGVEPIQILETTNDVNSETGDIQGLRFVKFQNVRNVQLFIENNVGGGEVTELTGLKFFGSPAGSATNMDNFKRVAGNKGEVGH